MITVFSLYGLADLVVFSQSECCILEYRIISARSKCWQLAPGLIRKVITAELFCQLSEVSSFQCRLENRICFAFKIEAGGAICISRHVEQDLRNFYFTCGFSFSRLFEYMKSILAAERR